MSPPTCRRSKVMSPRYRRSRKPWSRCEVPVPYAGAIRNLARPVAVQRRSRSAAMGTVMASFQVGLFVGGDDANLPRDNLDLERWFRQPKGHERHIHGHKHAGVRIVQEGPTLVHALDVHRDPDPLTADVLLPYLQAKEPDSQHQAIGRRKIGRRAVPDQNVPSCLPNSKHAISTQPSPKADCCYKMAEKHATNFVLGKFGKNPPSVACLVVGWSTRRGRKERQNAQESPPAKVLPSSRAWPSYPPVMPR